MTGAAGAGPPAASDAAPSRSLYAGRRAVLATMHGKEAAIRRPMRVGLGLDVVVPELDTDLLGTFTGEVERAAPPRRVVVMKARKGMEETGLSFGIANEGSFGPYPEVSFLPCDEEIIAFVDDEWGVEIVESTLTTKTNFSHCEAKDTSGLDAFLSRVGFPSHALIVRPRGRAAHDLLFKGVRDFGLLATAVQRCADASPEGLAHIETDMRAHMNPTRMSVIRGLAFRLVRRICARCPACRAPGWGLVGVERGLPCEWCDTPTEMVRAEVEGCARCDHRSLAPRRDGLVVASAGHCPVCNP